MTGVGLTDEERDGLIAEELERFRLAKARGEFRQRSISRMVAPVVSGGNFLRNFAKLLSVSAADRALKIASRALVKACGGGEGAAATLAAATGISVRQQRMSDCGNINEAPWLKIDEVGHLEDVAARDGNWPQVTRALAIRHGFLLVPLPGGDEPANEYLKIIAKLMKEGGEVSSALTNALADDEDVSAEEAAKVLPEVRDLIDAAVGLESRLQSLVHGGC